MRVGSSIWLVYLLACKIMSMDFINGKNAGLIIRFIMIEVVVYVSAVGIMRNACSRPNHEGLVLMFVGCQRQ